MSYTYRGQQLKVENVNRADPRLSGLTAGTYGHICVLNAKGYQTNVTRTISLSTALVGS